MAKDKPMSHPNHTIRKGISLLEVLIATVLLAGSMIVLSQLAFIGRKHLDRAERQATAVRLCQYKLGELLAGIEPTVRVDDQPLAEDSAWNYSIDIQPLEQLSLVELSVEVVRNIQDGGNRNTSRNRYKLIRWVYRDRPMLVNEGMLPTSLPDSMAPRGNQG